MTIIEEISLVIDKCYEATVNCVHNQMQIVPTIRKDIKSALEQTLLWAKDLEDFSCKEKISNDEALLVANMLKKTDIIINYNTCFMKDLQVFLPISLENYSVELIDFIDYTLKDLYITFLVLTIPTYKKDVPFFSYIGYKNRAGADAQGDIRMRIVLDTKNQVICNELEENDSFIQSI